ncbi:MAG: cytochrome b N-terminal domain-containing protein [Vicinamibacteria bacterium]|jgi:quinol-cytochrome oxidoreductase complex cytochrome b subunit|nr:cytochrome b N-terminal domain-containing protein [Vicinamibacteria bacterium]MBP9945826.1 cytochrome b N-terminal domain-containing protein [Vicinamibacteria bacterium]
MTADQGLLRNLLDLPTNVWRSIFRNPLPHSDLGRSQTTFTNLFLHIHPVKTHVHSLKPWYTMGLGVISLSLFIILGATGFLLMFYYVPSVDQAHNRMLDLSGTVAFGTLLRNMHRWGAHAMVAVVMLHLCRVFYTGSYRAPREFNWIVGVVLFLLTLVASFTGYLLPWDQLAFWAITVGTAIAGYAPFVGEEMRYLLLGDTVVGQEALIRFYVLHVAVIPAAMTMLILVHFWRIRKDGGLSRPEGADLPEAQGQFPEAIEGKREGLAPLTKTQKTRQFGVMGLVRGPFTKVGNTPDNTVYSWPNLFIAELFCFALTILVILLWSLAMNAPLEAPADPTHPPNPSKAPWYFLGLQEMVSYSAFWGGIGVPTIFVIMLLLLPYLDRGTRGTGVWFSRHRLLAVTTFTLLLITNLIFVIIGTFFRGPNWALITPW